MAYEDLGVEQLGSIYEHLLDDEPATRDNVRPRSQRKVTGSFYTPVALTDYLVRAALEPLVRGRTADDILSLHIVDPAMGVGRFWSPRAGFSRRPGARCASRRAGANVTTR